MNTRMIGIGSIALCAALCGLFLLLSPSPAAAQTQPSCNHAPGTSLEERNGGFVCVDANGVVHGQAKADGGQQANSKCGWNNFFTPPCIMVAIGSAISGLLISAAVIILTIVGTLFNWIVEYTIIFFSQNIFDLIRPAVRTGWTAFRDLGNIVIIGMFTYTALAMILGLQKFNAKAHVAKVLLIAILINFSFLFTSLIIDASNFAATQFYNSMGQVAQSSASLASVGTSDDGTVTTAAPLGISGLLMSYMGLTGTLDGFRMTWELGRTNDWGALAFFNGIFVTTLFIGVALVLLYGCFLLVSRALLLIFLMLTSALAFASYLVPGLANGPYGWSAWWRSLIQSAVLAPLLMIFLWATLLIAREIAQASPGGTIGSLVVNPTGGGNIGALFNYVIILGLLFISFKVSSSFASSIGGFNWAAFASLRALGAATRPGRLLLRRGTKYTGEFGDNLQTAAKERTARKGRADWWSRRLDNFSTALQATRKADFNAMRALGKTPLVGDAIGKAAGVKMDELAGKMRTREELVTDLAKASKERGERLEMSKEQIAAMTSAEVAKEMEKDPGIQERHKQYKETIAANEKQVAEMKQVQKETQESFNKGISELSKKFEQAQEAARIAPKDDVNAQDKAEQARVELEREHERKKEAFNEQQERINNAQRTINSAREGVSRIEETLKERAIESGALPKEFPKAVDIAQSDAYDRTGNTFSRIYHGIAGVNRAEAIRNEEVAREVRKTSLKEGKKKRVQDALSDYIEKEEKKDTKPEPPGPAPGTPASTT